MKLAIVTAFTLIFLAVAGGILWVHYYYLPYSAKISNSARNPISVPGVIPSPKTSVALSAINYLIQQGYSSLLNAVPIPLTLTSTSAAKSTNLSYLGLTFSAPWTGITKTIQKGNPLSFVEVDFTNGRSITIMRGLTSGTSTLAKFNSVSSTIRTDYDLDAAALSATPNEVTSSTPGEQATLITSLLILKASLGALGPVYSFKTATVEGFQNGDVAITRPVAIDLYDNNGNGNYLLTVKGSQEEIDSILASAQ